MEPVRELTDLLNYLCVLPCEESPKEKEITVINLPNTLVWAFQAHQT